MTQEERNAAHAILMGLWWMFHVRDPDDAAKHAADVLDQVEVLIDEGTPGG
jgi:hypothetical protein